MVAITVKNISPELHERLKSQAKVNHRSINKEVIAILERFTHSPVIDLDLEVWLQKAAQLREETAHYVVSDEEFVRLKAEGRK